MDVEIPFWVVLSAIPYIVVCYYGAQKSNTPSWLGSDRAWFLMFWMPVAICSSLLVALVYWVGVAKGVW